MCSSLIDATVVPAASDSCGFVVLAEVEEVKEFADVVADVEISEELGIVEEVDTASLVARVAVDCCAAVRVVVTVEVVSCAGVTACTVDGAEVAAASDEVGCLVEDCAGVLTEIAVVFWVVVVDGACEGCCVDVAAPTGDGAEVGTVDDGAGSSLEGAEVVVGDGSDGAEGCWFEVVSSTSSGWAAMYSRRFSLA